MKKRISAFLLAVLMVVMTFTAAIGDVVPVKADDLVLKLHYHRADGKYQDWDVWLWEEGGDGAAFTFDEEDANGDGVATKTVTPGCNKVGFIVRTKGSWDAKDVSEDQFIDLSTVTGGTVDFYVESGVAGGNMVLGGDVQQGVKVSMCSYNTKTKKIEIKTTSKLDDYATAFTVKCRGEVVAIKNVATNADKYIIELVEALDMTSSYTVTLDESEYAVAIPNIYVDADFEEKFTYDGDDLGSTWSKDSTLFKVWAPTASAVKVNLYTSGAKTAKDLEKSIDMVSGDKGTWSVKVDGDLNGKYYTYTVTIGGAEAETTDPYAHAAGVNGDRAMVIDLESTNPEGWDKDTNPNADLKYTDAIIYELHIRDLGADASSNISKPGTFLSLTEHGTKTASGIATGIDHIKELGITHLHILPMYDFGSVDENKGGFNWGYDPKNYNVPEGSYSTDPTNGAVRVKEAKEMVQSLHNDGISVVMDVVYNHVMDAGSFSYNVLVPNYFSREKSNGSGCGNDTASERLMVRKYIVDSVLYWTTEYHIDGFRFDLVGLIDTDTINEIVGEVHAIRPDVLFYGEGWTMTTNVSKEDLFMTTQQSSTRTPNFAFFNDSLRDDLKGSVFNANDSGFITGKLNVKASVARSWLGKASTWCKSPSQLVNYASCHDNMTLFDRICNTTSQDESLDKRAKRNNLAASIYMTAQGIPFMQAGEEMLRSKVNADGTYNENSYNASDEVNSLKWDTLDNATYMSTFNYYKGLVAFRKAHAGLRLATAEEVEKYVTPIETSNSDIIAYQISGDATGEASDGIVVIINPTEEAVEVTLPAGNWGVCINGERAGDDAVEVVSGTIKVDALATTALVLNMKAAGSNTVLGMSKPLFIGCIATIVAVIAIVIVVCVVVTKKKKGNK